MTTLLSLAFLLIGFAWVVAALEHTHRAANQLQGEPHGVDRHDDRDLARVLGEVAAHRR